MTAHVFGDERIVDWLDGREYHPQSTKDGESLCRFFVQDLAHISEPIANAFQSGKLAYGIDHDIEYNELTWDVDLLIGRPAKPPQSELGQYSGSNSAAEGELASVWFAGDAKAVMTAHGKARKNRARNVFSLAATLLELSRIEGVHPKVIEDVDTVGIALVNMADRFWNPDNEEMIKDNEHDNIREDSKRRFDLMRQTANDLDQIHSIGCIGLRHSNICEGTLANHPHETPEPTKLDLEDPTPKQGDPIHYRTFVENAAASIEKRL